MVSLKPFLHAGTALALAAALWLPGKLALSAGSSRTEANTGTERGARLLERSVVRIEVDGRRECIGVAISDSAVLTAKHCLKSSTSLAVRPSSSSQSSESMALPVLDVARHPRLDLAVLRVSWPNAVRVPQVELATAPIDSSNQEAVAVGWRASAESADRLGAPRVVSVKVTQVGRDVTASYDEPQGLCNGDSGSPLFIKNAAGQHRLIGVLRGGAPGCHGPDRFVPVQAARAWLAGEVQR